jgi:hypothetical protein
VHHVPLLGFQQQTDLFYVIYSPLESASNDCELTLTLACSKSELGAARNGDGRLMLARALDGKGFMGRCE